MQQEPVVYLIAGPASAAKSTAARLLASRLRRGVHLQGDSYASHRLAAAAADTYAEDGFSVVLEDVGAGARLGDYRTMIRSRPCHVVVLVPSADALTAGAGPRVGMWLDAATMTPEQTVAEILARTPPPRSAIVVSDYDAGWPALFERLAQPLVAAVAGLGARVEHVGSTSVPGLAAKPIIDIDVAVSSAADVPAAIERLCALGYVYQGDKGVKGCEAFLWPTGAPEHHVYVVVEGNDPHTNHVRFRDRLRGDPWTAQEYAVLKRGLAERYGADRLGYSGAKTEFVTRALDAAKNEGCGPPEGV